MKEATGELNFTVVVVLAVSLMSAFFFTVIWPMLRENTNQAPKCNQAVCDKTPASDNPGMVRCRMDDGTELLCVWKG